MFIGGSGMKLQMLGFFMFLISGITMDSTHLAVPVLFFAIGLIAIVLGGIHEKEIIDSVNGIDSARVKQHINESSRRDY